MKNCLIYSAMIGILLGFPASPLVASCSQRVVSRFGQQGRQIAARVSASSSTSQRFYSGMSKNKELAPTVAHLRSLDERFSDISLLERIRTDEGFAGREAKNTYETIEAYKDNKRLNSVAASVIRKEMRDLKDSEQYYTYYHSHEWPIDLAQRVYAEFYPSNNKEFFPLHFLTLINQPYDEQALIQLLQKEGNAGYRSPTQGEKYLLSVNAAFFGNLGAPWESTACYLAKSWSISPPNLSMRRLFTYFKHPEFYSNYEAEWEQVEALHAAASSHGKLWIIKIPKKVHSQLVIPTRVFGGKSKFVIDGKETDDVDLIQETLRTRPHTIQNIDRMQFRILMTPSTGLNQNLGIKTIPVTCADPEKYAAFEKAFYSLIAKIKAEIVKTKAELPALQAVDQEIENQKRESEKEQREETERIWRKNLKVAKEQQEKAAFEQLQKNIAEEKARQANRGYLQRLYDYLMSK
ncbi:MAG: hypothetical protein IT346_00860 [Epsilonproteobacteria bacterium]|nr:hypothetical protein [Campylobacterota bacterium]